MGSVVLTWTTASTPGLLVVATFLTAVVSAVVGLGGGMGLMAVMTVLLPAPAVVPLHGAVQLVSNLARSTVYRTSVKWGIYLPFAALVAVGVFVGAWLWLGTEMTWFRPAVGIYLLAFIAWRRIRVRPLQIPQWSFALVGLFAGTLTVLVGAVGPFIAPFFLREELSQQEMVATKAVCQLTLHVLKIPAFLTIGFEYGAYGSLLLSLAGAAVAGTLCGRWLIDRLRRDTFFIAFEVALVLIAVRLLWPDDVVAAQALGIGE